MVVVACGEARGMVEGDGSFGVMMAAPGMLAHDMPPKKLARGS